MYYAFTSVMKFRSTFELFRKFCPNFTLMLLKRKSFELSLTVWIENNLRFYSSFGTILSDALETFVFTSTLSVSVVLHFILFQDIFFQRFVDLDSFYFDCFGHARVLVFTNGVCFYGITFACVSFTHWKACNF